MVVEARCWAPRGLRVNATGACSIVTSSKASRRQTLSLVEQRHPASVQIALVGRMRGPGAGCVEPPGAPQQVSGWLALEPLQ